MAKKTDEYSQSMMYEDRSLINVRHGRGISVPSHPKFSIEKLLLRVTSGEYVPTYVYHIRKRQCFALLLVRSIYTGMLVLHHNFGRSNATNINY